MERGSWLVLLVLLPVVPPTAAAEGPTDTVCVYPERPGVEVENCGPRVPRIGVVLTLSTPTGTITAQVGCQEDCDRVYHVRVCDMVSTRSPVEADWEFVLEDELEKAVRDLQRSVHPNPPAFIDVDLGTEPDLGSCMPSVS